MAKRISVETMRRSLKCANVSFLLYIIVLFQLSAMVLLSLKDGEIDMQALYLAGIMPAVTVLLVKLLPKIWRIDTLILTLTLFLCSVSVITLTAIARSPITPRNQAIYIAAGLVAMLAGIVFIRHFKKWGRWKVFFMLCSLGFIALPLVIGDWHDGAKNWITIRPNSLTVQPSEFVKLSLAVVLASCLSERQSRAMKIAAIIFGALLCVILLLERDLGALLLYFFLTVILYFLATSNAFVSLLGLAAGAAGSVGAYYMFAHVRRRVVAWRNPWADYEHSGYQIIQSLIAIGSGGLFGMGLGLGMPRVIPLYHSDFVFAAICEQFGYLFAICLLAVYVLIVMRGVSIAMSCRDGFHALLAFGIVTMLGLQTLLIVGGNIRLIPLTGVTLPLIAAGGSSMVSCMGGIGLLLGISSLNADQDADDVERAERQEADAA